jgi:mRNA-degrading endonuclease YafQ of YafQ-DinJ toxin-antitoxin module
MTLRRRWKYEVNILADGGSLDARYRDHELSGNYKGVST